MIKWLIIKRNHFANQYIVCVAFEYQFLSILDSQKPHKNTHKKKSQAQLNHPN